MLVKTLGLGAACMVAAALVPGQHIGKLLHECTLAEHTRVGIREARQAEHCGRCFYSGPPTQIVLALGLLTALI